MALMIVGLVINLLVCFGVLGKTEGPEAMPIGLFYGAVFFWLLSVVGLVIALAGKRRIGGILVIVGSIVFVPIGLIAVFGARKLLDRNVEADLESRRRAAVEGQPPSSDGAA